MHTYSLKLEAMKLLMVILLYFIVQGDAIRRKPLEGNWTEICLERTGMERETVMYMSEIMPPKNNQTLAYLECATTLLNGVNKNGTLDFDFVKEDVTSRTEPYEAEEILQVCWQETQNLAENVYMVYECISKEFAKMREN